jgi:hypothetical protein
LVMLKVSWGGGFAQSIYHSSRLVGKFLEPWVLFSQMRRLTEATRTSRPHPRETRTSIVISLLRAVTALLISNDTAVRPSPRGVRQKVVPCAARVNLRHGVNPTKGGLRNLS